MQTSSKTSPRPPQPKQILLIGLPGSGKTTLAMQFPEPYFLDADMNLDGPELRLRKQHPSLSFKYDMVAINEKGLLVEEHLRIDRLLKLSDEAQKDPTIKTIIYDGLTNIDQYLTWQIMKSQNRDTMETRDWGIHTGKMMSLLVKQRMTGKTTIMTCHREDKTKKKAGNIMEDELVGYVPLIRPGLQQGMPGMFTDVWWCELKQKPGNEFVNTIRTMPTTHMPYLKNSLGLPPEVDITTNAWATLSKYWPS